MSVPVTFLPPGLFPVGYCWTNPQQFLNDSSALLNATVNAAGKVIVSGTAPAPADQDAVWVRLVGNLIEGIYTFSGGWFRPHRIAPNSPERMIWTSTELNLWSYDGGDGTNPSISPPTVTTGSFWQRDTAFGSDDGTSSFKFPVGIGVNPTSYDGHAATTIAIGTSPGGQERETITSAMLPSHTHQMPQKLEQHGTMDNAVVINAGVNINPPISQDGQANGNTGDIVGVNTPNLTHSCMPPWIPVIFAKRTSRAMIQAM